MGKRSGRSPAKPARRPVHKKITCAALIALAFDAGAAQLAGTVVAVADGDTLTVLVDQRQVRVRLAEIDAPESHQPFGTRSRESLAELCHRKDAEIETAGQDRYGRTIARVICAGTDANAEQVRRGMAWVFVRYAAPSSPLYALESEARAMRAGLWRDPKPVAPWEWRRKPQ